MGTALALAMGTAGIKPTGKAKRAMAAKSKVWVPWVQGMAQRKVKRLLQEGKCMPEMLLREGKGEWALALPPSECNMQAQRSLTEGKQNPKALPPEGEHKHSTMLQGSPNEGEYQPGWLLQELLCEEVLSTWEGLGPCNPGGRLPREHIVDLKRLVESRTKAMHQALIPTTKAEEICPSEESARQYNHKKMPMHLAP